MIEILSCEEYRDVLSWIPSGTGFIIYKKKKFLAEVLPKFFKQSKFTSFTRKLNRWGFIRIVRGPETGSYFHKLFHRDHPHLCLYMRCNYMHQTKQPEEKSHRNHHTSQIFPTQTSSQECMTVKPPSLDNIKLSLLPFEMHLPTALVEGISNPVVDLQRKLQMEHILKQRIRLQKMENESIQQAMSSPYDSILHKHIVNQNRNEFLFMQQMIAQSEASSMSAKPILDAIENSILKISPSVIDATFIFPGLSSQQILNLK